MASTIKLKNGSGAPTTGDLVQGEPALDLTNKRLYTENASGVVIEVGTNPSTIDINAGTIDGTVIGGTTPAAITGTTITGTSFVSSGDMTFEDNDKAVFGNGSDLRIYHTGSHSTIENIGTGHLQIHSTDFRLRNSAGTESMILANADGNVQLYYDNAEKLATTATGIDVTGTVTADKVTIGTSSASNAKLTLEGVDGGDSAGIYFNNTTATNGKSYSLSSGNSGEFMLYDRTSSAYRLFVSSAGNISFYEDTGTTAKFFWDASEERLGIGTTSPSVDLDVEGTAQVNLLEVTHDADRAVNFVKTGANTFSIEHDVNQFYFWNQTTSESPLLFQNDGDVIMNGGNVGIGTSSPASALDIIGANQDAIKIRSNVAPENYYQIGRNQSTGLLEFKGSETTYNGYLFKGPSSDLMTINSSGNVGIGTSSPSRKVSLADSVNGYNLELQQTSAYNSGNQSGIVFSAPYNIGGSVTDLASIRGGKENATDEDFGGKLAFYTRANGGSDTERMRIDSSGNVGIGVVPSSWASNTFDALQLGVGIGVGNLTARVDGINAVGLGLNWYYGGGATNTYVASSFATNYVQEAGTHKWLHAASGTAGAALTFTESMRIDSSGNLLVGCTTLPSSSVKGAAFLSSADQGRLYVSADSTAARDLAYFINPNGVIGTITTTSSSTAYNTSSDYRLKENITDANDAGDKIDAIKVRQYDWKTDGSHQDYGMVAQELMTVAPEAVSGDPESDEMMGVDYSKLVPMMLKEIQSLRARVAQLEGAN
jgi:hypothetical protein